jgi:hypothetical protein
LRCPRFTFYLAKQDLAGDYYCRCVARGGIPHNTGAGMVRLTALDQEQEPTASGGEAGSGRGLGEMTRRKREIVGLRNERDFPHVVELALPPGGFRSVFLQIDAFHRERRIPVRRGRSRREVEQVYIRFCFPDTAAADAFRNRFGGERLTYAPENSKPRRTSRA